MSFMFNQDNYVEAQVLDLITREREKALSRREWKHRLAGYGYSIRETDAGDMLETLPHRVEICMLPADISA